MNVVVFIPARMESSRFPNKPLAVLHEQTLLEYTYNTAKELTDNVIVLTQDKEIFDRCREVDMECRSTNPNVYIPTGTHRIAKFVEETPSMQSFDRYICWQVDEPLLQSESVGQLLGMCGPDEVGTLVRSLEPSDVMDPNAVKVVWFPDGHCQWFTRAPIRTKFAHVGIYTYSKEALHYFFSMGRHQTQYAYAESLEQLNWIEHGGLYQLAGMLIDYNPLSINTPNDWKVFCDLVDSRRSS